MRVCRGRSQQRARIEKNRERGNERERARERGCSRLFLARYSVLYLSHSLIPSSSCTVHSFVRPLLAPPLSFSLFPRVNVPSLSLSVLRARANTHVHSSRLCLITARIVDPPASVSRPLSLSLSRSLPLPRAVVLVPGTSLPLVPLSSPRDIFSLLPPPSSSPPPTNLTHPQRCGCSDVRMHSANPIASTVSRKKTVH